MGSNADLAFRFIVASVRKISSAFRQVIAGGIEDQRPMDDIKRTTAPETRNGSQWEIQLGAIPPREWLELFKLSGASSATAVPRHVVFDRATAFFKSDEQHVEHWIRSIDKWIASTNVRYAMSLEEASRERAMRDDAKVRERERIGQLNERFKHL